MDLSTRKYINNTKPQLPKFNLRDEIMKVSGGLTPSQLLSKSLYKPTNLPKTLPASTMKSIQNNIQSSLKTPASNAEEANTNVEEENLKTPALNAKSAGNDYVGAAVGVLDTATGIIKNSKPTVTAQELLANAPIYNENIAGIQTEQYGAIDERAADVDVAGSAVSGLASGAASGAALGSVIPGLGTVAGGVIGGVIGGIGGFFGGKSKKEEQERILQEAKRKRINLNQYLFEHAQSQQLQMKEAEKLGNINDKSLFHKWAVGKEPDINPMTGMSYKNFSVNTAYGKQNLPQNAWVSKGEVIESPDGSMYKVGFGKFAKGKEGVDTERAFIQNGDTIYSNAMINPDTGHTFAEDAPLYREMNMLPRLRMNQKMTRNGLQGYKCGIEKFANGYEAYTNLIPTVAGLLGSYQQYKDASQPLYTPDVNTENAYADTMIPKLMSLKQDYYPIWKKNLETQAAARAATRASGGLSAGQKALAYANLYNNTQQNNAKVMFDAQLVNNQLSQKAYETALSVGAQDAARKQQGNIFNAEFLAKAHNAAQQGRQVSLFNAINALQNYYANEFKRKQFDRTMSNYEAQTAIDRAKTQAMIKAMQGNNETASAAPTMTLKSYIDNLDQGTTKHMQTDWMNPIVQQRFADKYAPAPDYTSMIKNALAAKRRTAKKSKRR